MKKCRKMIHSKVFCLLTLQILRFAVHVHGLPSVFVASQQLIWAWHHRNNFFHSYISVKSSWQNATWSTMNKESNNNLIETTLFYVHSAACTPAFSCSISFMSWQLMFTFTIPPAFRVQVAKIVDAPYFLYSWMKFTAILLIIGTQFFSN